MSVYYCPTNKRMWHHVKGIQTAAEWSFISLGGGLAGEEAHGGVASFLCRVFLVIWVTASIVKATNKIEVICWQRLKGRWVKLRGGSRPSPLLSAGCLRVYNSSPTFFLLPLLLIPPFHIFHICSSLPLPSLYFYIYLPFSTYLLSSSSSLPIFTFPSTISSLPTFPTFYNHPPIFSFSSSLLPPKREGRREDPGGHTSSS